jgi:Zn-dependent protease
MRWELTLLMLPGLIVGLTCHEFAHAWSASLLGDDFARRQGRVSLNPLRHLTPLGTLALLFLPIGWGKPVLVNLYNFKHPRRDYLLSSLAGPLANVFVAGLCLGLMQLTRHPFRYEGWVQAGIIQAHTFLTCGVIINVALATLNLFPIPPLDGSKIWPCLLPNVKLTYRPKTNLVFFVLLLVLVFSHQLQPIMQYTIEGVMRLAPQSDVFLRMSAAIECGNEDLKARKWAEAERYFSDGLALDSHSDYCYYCRAMALYGQGKSNEALRDIDRAIDLNPDPHFRSFRVDILSAIRRTAEVKKALPAPD